MINIHFKKQIYLIPFINIVENKKISYSDNYFVKFRLAETGFFLHTRKYMHIKHIKINYFIHL